MNSNGLHEIPTPGGARSRSGSADNAVSISPQVISGIVIFLDFFIVLLTGMAAFWINFGIGGFIYKQFSFFMMIISIIFVGIGVAYRVYEFEAISFTRRVVYRVVRQFVITIFIFAVFVMLWRGGVTISTIWIAGSVAVSFVFVFIGRAAFYVVLYRLAEAGRLTRNLLVVGGGPQGQKLIERLKADQKPWNRVIGVFDDRLERIGDTVAGVPVLGDLDKLTVYIRQHHVDEVIVALPWSADNRLLGILNRLQELPVHISLGSDLIGYQFPHRTTYSLVGGVPVLNVMAKPLSGWQHLLKLLEDRVLAALIVVAFSPILLSVALAVRLESPGPVIFRQKRYGFNNQVFYVFKFRSMYHNMTLEDAEAERVKQATKDDPRITRVGRFIRKSSLDELPQLFNVLNGTMSLVGPRPHAVAHNEEYARLIDGYFARHKVKPGITGWAQVNGFRGETDTVDKMEARVNYDVSYIENWSLLFDIQILLMTAFVGFVNKNAY